VSRGRYSERYTDPSVGVPPVYQTGAAQDITGAGAVTTDQTLTNFTSDGAAQALTLADGGTIGQIKVVTHVVDGGSGVLTPANFVDGSTITFTGAAESWTGMWTAAGWVTIGLSGGAAVPAIA
jgi:hypothetical protein